MLNDYCKIVRNIVLIVVTTFLIFKSVFDFSTVGVVYADDVNTENILLLETTALISAWQVPDHSVMSNYTSIMEKAKQGESVTKQFAELLQRNRKLYQQARQIILNSKLDLCDSQSSKELYATVVEYLESYKKLKKPHANRQQIFISRYLAGANWPSMQTKKVIEKIRRNELCKK